MAGFSMSSASTQYVLVPVRAWNQGTLYNPTGLPVKMAFLPAGSVPASADWHTASWAWTTTSDGYYAAQCLVGPENSGVILASGIYAVWVQVTGTPEVPVQNAGALTIT